MSVDRAQHPRREAGGDDESLVEAFWAVARRLRRVSMHSLEPQGILPSHFRALGTLMRHGTMRLSELSEHLHIAARSATEVVDALEERGLAERRPDPNDRRATLVAVTPAGDALWASIRSARTQDTESLFEGLAAADRAELARILRSLLD